MLSFKDKIIGDKYDRIAADMVDLAVSLGLASSSAVAKPEDKDAFGNVLKKSVTLKDHTRHVVREAVDCVVPAKRHAIGRTTLDGFIRQLALAAAAHDIGKGFHVWQGGASDGTLGLGKVRHELIYLPKFIQMWGKGELTDAEKTCVIIAIAAHHGKLGIYHRHRFADIDEFYADRDANPELADYRAPEWFRRKSQGSRKIDLFREMQAMSDRYLGDHQMWLNSATLRYLLILADGRASGKETGDPVMEFHSMAGRIVPPPSLRPLQQRVEGLALPGMLLLRAPTAEGKTYFALRWAELQIAAGRADRLLFALPTRFTSSVMADKINRDYGGGRTRSERDAIAGTYHSSAWFGLNRDVEETRTKKGAAWTDDDQAVMDYTVGKFGANAWARKNEYPITVSTIDHLLACATLRDEDLRGGMVNLVGGCVVIDEADFYDSYLQENLMSLLRILKKFDVPVLLMSATLPESYACYVKEMSGYEPVVHDFAPTRDVRYNIRSTGADIDTSLLRRAKSEPTIIYANTVERAKAYRRFLVDDLKADEKEVLVYHSRLTQEDRDAKEKTIHEWLGEKAWKDGTAHGIVIMTQVGEMSIDVSTHFMISDMCPIDRLTQRLGRAARFGFVLGVARRWRGAMGWRAKLASLFATQSQDAADVLVFTPADIPYPYVGPDAKSPLRTYLDTASELSKLGAVRKSGLMPIVDRVYRSFDGGPGSERRNASLLTAMFRDNWMLNPTFEEDPENPQAAGSWTARNIRGEVPIFIDDLSHNFCAYVTVGGHRRPYVSDWKAFEKAKHQKMVRVRGSTLGKIEKIGGGTKEVHIWRNKSLARTGDKNSAQIVLRVLKTPGIYTQEMGITV